MTAVRGCQGEREDPANKGPAASIDKSIPPRLLFGKIGRKAKRPPLTSVEGCHDTTGMATPPGRAKKKGSSKNSRSWHEQTAVLTQIWSEQREGEGEGQGLRAVRVFKGCSGFVCGQYIQATICRTRGSFLRSTAINPLRNLPLSRQPGFLCPLHRNRQGQGKGRTVVLFNSPQGTHHDNR